MLPKNILKAIHRIEIKTIDAVDDLFSGAYHSAFKGQGMEFEEVREYQMGDDVRSIDWNVTARMQHPFVKNYREERELTVLLLVDLSASSRFGSQEWQKRELITEIAALLAFSAIKNNDRVGLILFTDIVEKYIPPKKGKAHVLRVIRDLLLFTPKSQGTNIGEALSFLGKLHKRSGICFVISDFFSPPCKSAFAVAAKQYDLISLAVNDPREFSFPDMGLVRLKDWESEEELLIDSSCEKVRQVITERAQNRLMQTRKEMKAVGAGFLSFSTDHSYVEKLRRFFQSREKRSK